VLDLAAFNKRKFVGASTTGIILDDKVNAGNTYTYAATQRTPDGDVSNFSNLRTIPIPK